MDNHANNLITRLLHKDPSMRIGKKKKKKKKKKKNFYIFTFFFNIFFFLGITELEEIKNHIWFEEVDWETYLKEPVPPPFVPLAQIKLDEELRKNGFPPLHSAENYEKILVDF